MRHKGIIASRKLVLTTPDPPTDNVYADHDGNIYSDHDGNNYSLHPSG